MNTVVTAAAMARVALPRWIIGGLTFVAMTLILMVWGLMLLPGILLRCLPVYRWQRQGSRYCVWLASKWVLANRRLYHLLHGNDWQVRIEGELHPERSYLLVANHQSWADILVLFDALHERTPFARFFMKQELKYVPIIGAVCWAMDMPFMTRRSSQTDIRTIRETCAVYREVPVTIVNFLEGTRSTAAKREAAGSPYRHLMPPKTGGLCYTLNAMGDQLDGIIDVTLVYEPTTRPLAWSWLCGEQRNLIVSVRLLPLPEAVMKSSGEAQRRAAQQWLHALWQEKDARLEARG